MSEPPTTPGDFLRRVSQIQPWKRHDQRAPHKPLLLLLALGRSSRGEERLVPFVEVEEHFRELWRRFGPPRSGRAYYPFGRLAKKDGLWDIPKQSILRSWHKEDLSPVELRDRDIEGGFPEEVFALLKSDPELALEAAQLILHGHFPISLHDEILEAVGFASDSTVQEFPTLVREPAEEAKDDHLPPSPQSPLPAKSSPGIRRALRDLRVRPADQRRAARSRGRPHPVALP